MYGRNDRTLGRQQPGVRHANGREAGQRGWHPAGFPAAAMVTSSCACERQRLGDRWQEARRSRRSSGFHRSGLTPRPRRPPSRHPSYSGPGQLACGTTVVPVAPRGPSIRSNCWPPDPRRRWTPGGDRCCLRRSVCTSQNHQRVRRCGQNDQPNLVGQDPTALAALIGGGGDR